VFPSTRFEGLDLAESIQLAQKKRWIDRAIRGIFPQVAASLAAEAPYDVVSMSHYLEHTCEPRTEIVCQHAVVIGRSPILGKPMAMMLLNANATVTICHSRTANLPEVVRTGDIVVAAVGKPRFVRGDWVREGAVVVDAGYHPERVGDVALDEVAPRTSAYTPVPGGVGPMTISMLLEQTVTAAERYGRAPRNPTGKTS
jgi:5,10-methylene-tetrahydrofolate dehydrogenase/methenyl tetrahydrofolate cyclohydrolase